MKKTKNIVDYEYRAWLEQEPCSSGGPCCAAHQREGADGGTGLKPSDMFAVPLCHACHGLQHRVGEKTFWGPENKYQIMVNCITKYRKEKK